MDDFIKSITNWLQNDSFDYLVNKIIGDNLPSFAFGVLLNFIKVIYHIVKISLIFSILLPLLWITSIALYFKRKSSISEEIQDIAQLTLIIIDVQYFFRSYYKSNIEGRLKLNF